MNKKTSRFITNDANVLIDTWWNVNCTLKGNCCPASIVLIDTWWNVNDGYTKTVTKDADVLIDTWWNVNNILFC